jgi:hypothetical protein
VSWFRWLVFQPTWKKFRSFEAIIVLEVWPVMWNHERWCGHKAIHFVKHQRRLVLDGCGHVANSRMDANGRSLKVIMMTSSKSWLSNGNTS